MNLMQKKSYLLTKLDTELWISVALLPFDLFSSLFRSVQGFSLVSLG